MKSRISNFMKIRSVTAELFHVDRQTEGRMDGRTDAQLTQESISTVLRKLKKRSFWCIK